MIHFRHLIAIAATVAIALPRAASQPKIEIPNDQKLGYAERIIESFYLDDVDGNKIVQEAIVAMLKTLDPHSSYSDPEETKELTTPLEGNFSGIGIQFNMLNDTLYVIQTIAGGPSEKVGLLPGDRILRADTVTISGAKKANADIIKVLRGPKGTDVDLRVIRRGIEKPLNFRVTRDDIPLNSIDAYFMADENTGFIRLTRFAETTGEEFVKAINDLLSQGMNRLVIDLEDNGGGYLGSAVELASHFLNRGDLVTYTDSPKFGIQNFEAEYDGQLRQLPLVVMVNQFSASASEILSGAIQDHDRGIIVGRRTFGKGLVQRPFPFPDGSMIRLTVSRYHTPSGRVIQKPYEKGKSEDYLLDMKHRYESGEFSSADSIQFADSLRCYTLRHHRTVYGGGGIMPDVFVPVDTTFFSEYYRDLTAKGAINATAINYVDNNRKALKKAYPTADDFIARFEITPEIMQALIDEGTKNGVEYNAEQYDISRDFLTTLLKALIGRDLFESSIYYRIVYPRFNPIYIEALRLINDPDRYTDLLTPAPPTD